jgi:hypothetical protein
VIRDALADAVRNMRAYLADPAYANIYEGRTREKIELVVQRMDMLRATLDALSPSLQKLMQRPPIKPEDAIFFTVIPGKDIRNLPVSELATLEAQGLRQARICAAVRTQLQTCK